MNNKVENYLKFYKNATITLSQLEALFPGDTDYNSFAAVIKELIDRGILTEKNPENNNRKEIPLAYKFAINRYELRREHIENIQNFRLKINPVIDLEAYHTLSEETWNRDLHYIVKVNQYILAEKLPEDYVTSQERSFHMVGDEKWIDEKGGRKLLGRIKLWDKLKIMNSGDPLMLAVNPLQFSRDEHFHMIVENKATFLALMDVLGGTKFTSLIFGSGWKIVSNITMLEKQLGLKGKHKLYYFGDLDYEGISIWNSLKEKVEVQLAVDFYKELIKKSYSKGKENQVKNEKALSNFVKLFNSEEGKYIIELLENKSYIPQEGLDKEELGMIWRNIDWA
jgi:Uncharacterized protein conserved in bacteria